MRNVLTMANSVYRLWPCKIEKSDVLKLFLGIALGPPITEIPILIGWGKLFFFLSDFVVLARPGRENQLEIRLFAGPRSNERYA